METLIGTVEKIICAYADYTILKIRPTGKARTVSAIIYESITVKKGTIVTLHGNWEFNPKYQEENFVAIKTKHETNNKDIAAREFLTKICKGVGTRTASEIVATLGNDIKNIMENNDQLLKIKGITEKKLKTIVTSYEKNNGKALINIFELFNGDVTPLQAEKIYSIYGDSSVEVIKNNPYLLIYDIDGFGFKKVDSMAKKIGYQIDSRARVSAGISYVMQTASNEKGHCFLYHNELIEQTVDLLLTPQDAMISYYSDILKTSIPDKKDWKDITLGAFVEKHATKFKNLVVSIEKKEIEKVEKTYKEHGFDYNEIEAINKYVEIKETITDHIYRIFTEETLDVSQMNIYERLNELNLEKNKHLRFVVDTDNNGNVRFYNYSTALLETVVIIKLIRLVKSPILLDIDDDKIENVITEYEQRTNRSTGDEQKEAVRKSLKSRVSIITGGPGRGKTTIETMCIDGWEASGGEVVLLAPTGRSAQRMSEATNRTASTVHKYKSIWKSENAYNQKPKMFLIDEMSMITLQLMDAILDFAADCHLVLIGDADQLPCIGLGNIFADAIASEKIACTKLIQCYRNAGSISDNSDVINDGGRISELKTDHSSKLLFCSTDTDAAETVIKVYGKMLERYDKKDILILSPSLERGKTSVLSLNLAIQETFNPKTENSKETTFAKTLFRVGDRVIHKKNNYFAEWYNEETGESGIGIFNGELGEIIDVINIQGENNAIVVRFDDGKIVNYIGSQKLHLQIAYAMTIHKAQGSEAPVIINCLMDSDHFFLCRKTLYTAETRARDLYVHVGTTTAMQKAIKNANYEKRNTAAKELLVTNFDLV